MSGERAGLELALAEADPVEASDDEQLELLGIDSQSYAVKAVRELRTSKIGRPPGARNKRTLEMAQYLLSRYRSPLEGLLALANARVDELAVSLGCTKFEAMQEKRLAWMAALPYCHSKMPIAVDVTNRKIVRLIIEDDGDGAVMEGDDFGVARIIENAIAHE